MKHPAMTPDPEEMMQVPLDVLIDEAIQRRQTPEGRIAQLDLPVAPPGWRPESETISSTSTRGVTVISMFGDEDEDEEDSGETIITL